MTDDESGPIAALRAGDIRGLETLVHLHQHRALRVAFQIVASPEVAEDVVADAFVTVYDRIAQFDARRPFAPWFYRIVVNAALKAAASRQKTTATPPTEAADQSIRWSPERETVRREERDLLLTAIQELPDKQRVPLILRYYLDFDEAAIAETLGIPRGTVKWRLHSARQKLKSRLAATDVMASAHPEGEMR